MIYCSYESEKNNFYKTDIGINTKHAGVRNPNHIQYIFKYYIQFIKYNSS